MMKIKSLCKKVLSDKVRSFGKVFSSPKFTIPLLVIIILVLILGTFLPQGEEDYFYQHKYNFFYPLIKLLNLNNVYYSGWFIFVLVLLGVNVFFCWISVFLKKGWKWDFFITHLAIIIVLVGCLIYLIKSERGVIILYKNKKENIFYVKGKVKQLPFAVELVDFRLLWYKKPHQFTIVLNKENIKEKINLEVGEKYFIPHSSYAISLLEYFPDFYINNQKLAATKTSLPKNPAVLVEIEKREKEKIKKEGRWLFSRYPQDSSSGKDKNINLKYKWRGAIKNYQSYIKVYDDRRIKEAVIEVNKPLKFKKYTFYQTDYDKEFLEYSVLQVARTSGLSLIYSGFFLLNIGVFIYFFKKTAKIN